MKSNMQLKYSNYVAFSHDHGFVVNNSGLFKIIPLSGIPTYKEFDEVDENTREFSEMLYAYKKRNKILV